MRLALAALLVALGLALPASALAQSAGDNQYVDPFAGQSQPKAPSNPGSSGSSGQAAPQGGSAGQTTSSAQPAPAPQAQTSQSSAPALPRTGLAAALPAVTGLLMVLGGALLRLIARPPRRVSGGRFQRSS